MTSEEIEERLQLIRDENGDPETAHEEEDKLMADFVAYVASLEEYLPELAAKAKQVLKTAEISFPRWYA